MNATWFLPCLFFTEILFVLIVKYNKTKKIIVLLILSFSIIPFIGVSNNQLYIDLMRVFIGLVFLGIGYYSFNTILSKMNGLIFPICFIAANIVLSQVSGQVDLFYLSLGNYFSYFLSAICGTFGILLLFKQMKEIRWVSFFGVNSLIIMATHLSIIKYPHKSIEILDNWLQLPYFELFDGLMILIVVVLIEIPIIYVINNHLPLLIGKKTSMRRHKKGFEI